MEGTTEIENFIKICVQVLISLCYCYFIGKSLPKGVSTLIAILPIVFFFLTVPLSLHTMHLCGTVSFFITWLTNLKLLLFAFGKGPLSDPSFSLKQFLVVASFPIKTENYKPRNRTNSSEKSSPRFYYIIKLILFGVLLKSYMYKDYMHPMVLSCLFSSHIYLSLEINIGIVSAMARILFGVEIEPYFREPYLATSLQDFWGRRWNLAATNILRLSVYEPTNHFVSPLFRPNWVAPFAIFTTFIASGLIHELIFLYLGRVRPTWEITMFFVLHGMCLLVEIVLKKKLAGKLWLPKMVSRIVTIGFVMVTAYWLFFPPLLRRDGYKRAIHEYAAIGEFAKSVARTLILVINALTSFV